MRDYRHLDRYLRSLTRDVYPQPPDSTHLAMAKDAIDGWLSKMDAIDSILDVGCGQGQMMPLLQKYASRVAGVTLGDDLDVAQQAGLEVYEADFSFLPFASGEFYLLFARHALEHSPMPLLTLMEWHRVARHYLLLVVPSPEAFGVGGRNHYFMLTAEQWEPIIRRAGWVRIWESETEPVFEHRWLLQKEET